MSTKKLMTDWLLAKQQETEAAERRYKIEMLLYTAVMEQVQITKEGTTNFEDDGLKLTITSRMDVKVDQEKAAQAPHLFKLKYEYSKTLLKTLGEDAESIHDYITIKPAKPTFAVKVL